MNKQQLVATMAAQLSQSQKQTKHQLEHLLLAIKHSLMEGDKIFLPQFGTFELRYRLPQVARNPKTGEAIDVEGQNQPSIKFSPVLKAMLNEPQT
jgi:DNA-binding protein HU-alpha